MRVLDDRKMMSVLENERTLRLIIGATFGIPSVLVILLTPILAWFNFGFTKLDTSYYTLRYLIIFLYILGNVLTSIFQHVKNFAFLMTDGVLLSQLTSLYLYNEFSMSALLTILPVLFVL
jgi:hypothetical protein